MITNAIKIGSATATTQDQTLKVVAKGVRHIGDHPIGARVKGFNDLITCIVDHKSIVASSAIQPISTQATIQVVIAATAQQHITAATTAIERIVASPTIEGAVA